MQILLNTRRLLCSGLCGLSRWANLATALSWSFVCGCQVFSCFGISSLQAHGKFRVTGMVGTFTTIAVSAPWLLNAYLIAL